MMPGGRQNGCGASRFELRSLSERDPTASDLSSSSISLPLLRPCSVLQTASDLSSSSVSLPLLRPCSVLQVEQYHRDGVLFVPARDAWSESELKQIIADVAGMDDWADAPGKYMKYYEHKVGKDNKTVEGEVSPRH
jgi:hypothetical protein